MKAKTKTYDFDMASSLKDKADIQEYLSQVVEDGDHDELLRAFGHAARARGMLGLANDTGLSRESLYKALRPGSNPRFETIRKVADALGMKVMMVAKVNAPNARPPRGAITVHASQRPSNVQITKRAAKRAPAAKAARSGR